MKAWPTGINGAVRKTVVVQLQVSRLLIRTRDYAGGELLLMLIYNNSGSRRWVCVTVTLW